jgi:hypothetical protein
MKKNLPAVRTAQSPEITNALLQYPKHVGECWEKTVNILRQEALDSGSRFGKRCSGGLFLDRICGKDFFNAIDPGYPKRAIAALKFISQNPLVIKNPFYYYESFIWQFKEMPNGEYLLGLTPAVVTHYLADNLSVEYSEELVLSFNKTLSRILYKKGCMLVNGVWGHFDMEEEEIRLMVSIDTVKKDEQNKQNLKKSKISEIDQLPIIKSGAYTKFAYLVRDLVKPALDDINKAYEEGRCPFSLRPEIRTTSVNSGKRGKPKQKNVLRFYIEDPKSEIIEEPEILDADAVEVVEDSGCQPHQKAVEGVQMEIPFTSESLSDDDKLSEIEGQITEIFRVSEATHIGTYPQCITNQIRERLQTQVNLPDAVGAWIEYCKNFIIKNNQGDEKYIETKQGAKEVARLLQSSLEIHNHLVYESARKKGRKDHLKWNGKDRVMFPWDIDPNFYSNNSQNINSNGQSDNDQAAGSQLNSASAAAFGIWGQRKWNPPVV